MSAPFPVLPSPGWTSYRWDDVEGVGHFYYPGLSGDERECVSIVQRDHWVPPEQRSDAHARERYEDE